MSWTKQKPSASGFYFYRKDFLVVAAQVDEKMLRFTNGWYGTLQSFSGDGDWYGPLLLPPGTFPTAV
jgi:hypothetical protein